jgi:hypothetical protein
LQFDIRAIFPFLPQNFIFHTQGQMALTRGKEVTGSENKQALLARTRTPLSASSALRQLFGP